MAWKMAAGSDLALPEVDGISPLPDRVVNRYTNRVLSAAESDSVVAEQFIKVINLVDPPARLMRPSILFRVLLPACADGGRRGASPSRMTELRRWLRDARVDWRCVR